MPTCLLWHRVLILVRTTSKCCEILKPAIGSDSASIGSDNVVSRVKHSYRLGRTTWSVWSHAGVCAGARACLSEHTLPSTRNRARHGLQIASVADVLGVGSCRFEKITITNPPIRKQSYGMVTRRSVRHKHSAPCGRHQRPVGSDTAPDWRSTPAPGRVRHALGRAGYVFCSVDTGAR